MWIKVGTRGDYRVIYVILAFLVFLGLRSAYYSLYDLNGGTEKEIKIVTELNTVMPFDNTKEDSLIRCNDLKVTEHIGGARDFEKIFYTALNRNQVRHLYEHKASSNGWEKSNIGDFFVKNGMKMQLRFIDESEYYHSKRGIPKQMIGKTIFKIRIEIK